MSEVKCLVCGELIEIPAYIDAESFDGQIICSKCDSLLAIKLKGSKVQKYKYVGDRPKNPNNWTELVKKVTEAQKKTG